MEFAHHHVKAVSFTRYHDVLRARCAHQRIPDAHIYQGMGKGEVSWLQENTATNTCPEKTVVCSTCSAAIG